MRNLALALLLAAAQALPAQVELDAPIVFTAADSSARQVEGLTTPVDTSDLLVTGAAQSGWAHWCTAVGNGTPYVLTSRSPQAALRTGTLVRFVVPQQGGQAASIDLDGHGPRPLRRPDGLAPGWGQLEAGQVAEVEYRDSVFVLLNAGTEGCPAGFLAANDRLCMQVDPNTALNFYDAAAHCLARGGSLCTWDEYYFACFTLQGQLNGLFDDWEWIDDTSDHTHTADQSGRWSCRSQRSIGALVTETANFRCCLRKR